jgi:hypothetical protein
MRLNNLAADLYIAGSSTLKFIAIPKTRNPNGPVVLLSAKRMLFVKLRGVASVMKKELHHFDFIPSTSSLV